jgi:hypothetical protein
MPDRRTFLITCTGAVATPALSLFAATATATASGPAAIAATTASTPEAPVLRIDGWEPSVESGSTVWVQVSTSWRAAWR